MSLKNSDKAYGSVAKFFHWLIFFMLLIMVIVGFTFGYVPEDYQGFVYNIHKLVGLTIFTLMVLRLLWALTGVKPILPNTRAWERFAERTVHILLYLTVMAMPIVGLIGACAENQPPHLGNFNFMLPVPQSKELSDAMFNIHNTLAIVLIVLSSIHVSAALYHHFIRKDDVLRRMLPKCCQR